ncbi:MAG: VapC toxin family PIN domain ribonuclease [Desulfobacteraceae bacterium IS3]|nr:MAG: VapC toxin family PIN domain ribonuclease [Desulfobacteraceae bacterium IS3]
MVFVDSSVWIEGLRRDGDLKTKLGLEGLLEAYEAQLCSPVKLEVLGGARVEERKKLARCLSVIPYYSVTDADWEMAIDLGWKMRGAGHTIPWNDLLVAACALRAGERVYARDKHFQQIASCQPLSLYEPGYGGSYAPAE